MSIYLSEDSADVWAWPELFNLDKNGCKTECAGVPPDYFSEEGQHWGNPTYNWDAIKQQNFGWWIERLKHSFAMFDHVRLDHFRAFESYFAVPFGDKDVKRGKWKRGPGIEIFNKFKENDINNLILEDLGDISDEVRALRKQTELAGMKVMQFAFDGDSKNLHLPHDYEKNSVAYLGTHDNDTFMSFLKDKKMKDRFCEYLHLPKNTPNDIVTKMAIENLISTNSVVCVLTMQDILCEGSECRINTPGTDKGNWEYRLKPTYKEGRYYEYLKQLIKNKNR